MLTGTAVKNAEAVIKIDDKLVSNVFVADIDEAKNHWDVRSPYSAEMGNALAYTFDRNIAATIAKAARTGTNFNTDLPGGTRIKIVAANKAAITGAQLATAVLPLSAENGREQPARNDRYCVLAPAEYYKLVQETDVINRDWGGAGAYADGHRAEGCWHHHPEVEPPPHHQPLCGCRGAERLRRQLSPTPSPLLSTSKPSAP
jgi:hypothetical protein